MPAEIEHDFSVRSRKSYSIGCQVITLPQANEEAMQLPHAYRIECYTPAPKRRYGYLTLPILWRGQIVGRLTPKRTARKSALR